MPCLCVRSARGSSGGLGRVPVLVSYPFPPSRLAFPALHVAGRPVRLSLIVACRYAISSGLCVPRDWCGCPSDISHVPFACVCACAPAASAPFPAPLVGVARAPGVVPVQGAGRAVSCGPSPSAFPVPVQCAVLLDLGEGRPGPFPPVPGSWSCAPLWAGLGVWGGPAPGGRGGGGGGLCAAPPGRGRGAPRGWQLLYRGPSLCPHWPGTKAGFIGVAQLMEDSVSILLRFVSAC